MRADDVLFLTGATGFLGQELLAQVAERPPARIYCLARSTDTASADARIRAALAELGKSHDPRIQVLEGDLRAERLGLTAERHDALAREVTHVIHSAADVRFNQPLDAMRAINVGGARHIVALARACQRHNPRFSHLDYVSTAFVAGRRTGVVPEEAHDDRWGFKNTYEQAKAEAERVVDTAAGDLPLVIYRPSIVVGAAESGRANPRNVIYPLLKLFRRWRWPVVPIRRDVDLDIVPVDFVARAVLALSSDAANHGRRFHLAAGPEGDIRLGRMLALVQEEFGKRVGVLPVPIWRAAGRPLLRVFYREFFEKHAPVFQAFESYVWTPGPRFDTTQARAGLAGTGIALPETERFLRNCLRYARETEFATRDPKSG